MMQAWWNFCLCSLVLVVVSLLTPEPDPVVVNSLTWPNPLHVILHGKLSGPSDPRIVAAVLTVVMVLLYFAFH
jgi:SSS family solute:Na+ symporter